MFSAFDDDDDEYLLFMVRVLGRLPEPWWSTTWAKRKLILKDKVDEQGRVLPLQEEHCDSDPVDYMRSVHPSVTGNARSLLEKLAPGLWYMATETSPEVHRSISEKEKDVFADLLRQLLRFDPKERISAKEALGHEWFKMEF